MAQHRAAARLGPVDELDLRPVFQPIVDLQNGSVVGYEALLRGGPDAELRSATPMLEAARRENSIVALDLAARAAALASVDERGLAAPFSLFLNADAETLERASPDLPSTRRRCSSRSRSDALIARPEAMLRALNRLRAAGWGIALDDVGGDSRSLALMSILYPDVIKLDLRLLSERTPQDVARIVTAVGARGRPAPRHRAGRGDRLRRAARHAHGRTAPRSARATSSARPSALPDPLPAPGPRAAAARRGRGPVRPDAVGARDELAPAGEGHAASSR